jgi:uroporphyrinogen decarboxylase
MVNIPADKMTPKERMLAFLQGQAIDRTLAAPLVLNHAARILGVKISEYNQNGEVMGKAHVAAWKRYGHDMILMFSTTSTLAEAMGAKLVYQEDDAPYCDDPIVQTPDDIAKVKIPDPHKDGRLPVYLKGAEYCIQEVGDQVFVGCIFAAPFTTASHLRGTEAIIRDTSKNPEFVRQLMDLSKEAALRFIDALVEKGIVPVIVEPVASGSLISPKLFESLVLPYLKEIVEYTQAKGSPIVLHICGKTTKIIELMADSGANVLSIDQIDMAVAKEKVGSRVCLLGNVKPAETLYKGNPEKVMEECREIITKAGDSPGGLILSSGCEVPFDTPPENIEAVINAARIYGRRD